MAAGGRDGAHRRRTISSRRRSWPRWRRSPRCSTTPSPPWWPPTRSCSTRGGTTGEAGRAQVWIADTIVAHAHALRAVLDRYRVAVELARNDSRRVIDDSPF
jgi:hypothetical protein